CGKYLSYPPHRVQSIQTIHLCSREMTHRLPPARFLYYRSLRYYLKQRPSWRCPIKQNLSIHTYFICPVIPNLHFYRINHICSLVYRLDSFWRKLRFVAYPGYHSLCFLIPSVSIISPYNYVLVEFDLWQLISGNICTQNDIG